MGWQPGPGSGRGESPGHSPGMPDGPPPMRDPRLAEFASVEGRDALVQCAGADRRRGVGTGPAMPGRDGR
jgi:hypothetical protein